jgi:hypothetical protein
MLKVSTQKSVAPKPKLPILAETKPGDVFVLASAYNGSYLSPYLRTMDAYVSLRDFSSAPIGEWVDYDEPVYILNAEIFIQEPAI